MPPTLCGSGKGAHQLADQLDQDVAEQHGQDPGQRQQAGQEQGRDGVVGQ
jgi:hypothetical protein